MKSLFSFLLCVIILSNSGFSQVTGGRMNGESTPTEVKASSVTAGGVAGEVNLLNGSLNASYTLGTVSTPSGISYTATMSYSSVVSTGDTPPNVSGVPYGEGWKVNLPTISISTDVYNKYLQWEEQQMQTNISNDDKPYTRLFDNQTAQEEGDVYWYAPRLNIPGIAGGRMVYKYHQQNWHIFVLQKFDRYIEARFDGRTWEVFLDDGTIYEFAVRNISHTNASNQRLQPNVDDTNSLGNVVLPKSQILTWYCSRIKHRNKALNIRFHYDTYGCFNYYKELRQDGINSAINELGANGSGTRPPLLSACSEVFLREITAGAEKLVFEYGTEFFPNVGVSNLLDFRAADVSRKDSLYSVKTVYSRGGSGEPTFDDNWRRYYHIMRDDPQAANTQFTPPFNDPYKHTNASDGSRNYLFENIPDGSSEAVFNHGFLESERIQMSNTIPPGDIYEIVTKIEKDDVGIMGSLFDINIATGDNQTPQECPQCCQPSASSECSDEFDQNRGQSVFSTFNQAIKWGTSCIQHNEVELTTSNFFSLRNFPEQFEGFHIQVGPANSDMDFSRFREEDLDGGNCSPPNVCNAYFNKLLLGNYDPLNEELLDPGTRSGDAIQHKFGIGLPWHMMLPFYEEMDGDYALCSSSSFPWLEWWDNKAGSTCNMPTFAEDDHALKELKLKRYGKNTYLLRSVKKVVKNDQIDLQGNQPGPWYAVSNLKFTYELTPGIPVYTTATSPDLPGYLPKTFGLGVDRNIITLKKIIQLPLDGDETNIATAPTSHFEYSKLFNYTGFDVNEIEGGIITDFLILREITNPLGGKTEYTYYPFDSNSVFTISTFVSTLFSKPKLYFQPDNFYGMMINIPVQSKKIQDAQSVKYYHYHFGAKIGHWDIPGLNPHFRYMEASKSENAFGFKNATVFGPTTEADPSAEEGPEVKYYNHTTPELWGKVYKIEQKDEAGNWVSEREITYEAVLAFEPAFLRFVRVGSEYDYYDYFHDAAGGGQGLRPKIEDYTDLAAYFVGLRDWVLEDVNSSIEYVVWLTKQPVAPTFQCTDESGNTYTCGCAEFESLGVSEKEACTSYWANYSAWVSSKPDPSIEGLMHKEDADLLPSSGMYEAPKFYESRFGYDIYEKNPNYLNSYFIKKTQEVVKEYKGACDRSQYVETITDYDYFDADYRGMTSSSGYEELTGQTVPFQLHWEPSWQLYRTKTYSPDMGGETAAYTSSETYYLWDLVNDSYYQSGTTNYYPDVDFDLLWRTWAVKKTRNLPFEIRKIVKSPSDNEVTQTTYITYSKNWQTETEAAEIIEIDPSGIWPCDELEGDPAETGGDLPLPPCVVVKGDGVPPPNYCNPPEVNEPYIYCECDLPTIPGDVSYNLNPPDVNSLVGDPDYDFYNPYEDATDSEYVMFTIEGKIMPEKFIQRVGGSGEGVLRFDKNNAFLPNFEDIETLTTRQILSRNEYGQVVSEQNERGLVTKVTYNPIRVLIMPTCSYGEQVMVYEILENHVGLPKKVNVGEGLPDSLVTKYEYQMDNSIAKITDPNEIGLTYNYDEFGRMIEGLRNSELVKSVSYNNWDNVTADFVGKANQNFVEETLHLNGADSYGLKSFVDPLGRSVGKVKSSGAVSVNIEDNIFDIHGRTILQLPPSSSSGVTVVSAFPNADYAEYQYDIAPRGNPVKSSKFGFPIASNQSVSTDQCLIGSGVLSAALNDAGQLAVPDGGKFLEVKVEDEDDKIVKEYLNAFGQKAAIIVEDAVNGNSATVFKYSSHGGISQISNPENHITGYKFNYLGQVYEKKTADAGYEYFSYDHSGNMIGHKDANGVIRIFSFDIFGRSTRQAKAATEENLFTNNGMPWIADPGLNDLHLLFSSGQTKYEKRWFYNSYNLGNTNDISGGALPYLDYSLSGARGKLVQSTSYSQHGKPIEFHFYSYNSDGFLKWEISQFNYNGIRFSQKGMAHRIDYRSYNRQGSVMLQEVDLGCNQSLDFQYEYDYDSWNRIEKVSVSFDGIDKHKVVEYQYDDEKGVVSQKKYYAGAENCNNYKIDQLDYEYDDPRFRMTKMTSRTFDWELFYDDEHIPDNPVGELETTNYNGNINASKANYKYHEFENPPPESFAGQKTYYNYEYDGHNRLSEADAYIEQLAMQTNDFQLYENYGNASYLYDKAGNFTTLTRHDLHGPSSIVPYEHTYQYEPNTNKVTEVYRFDYDLGISKLDRTCTYDNNGNILSDTKRAIASVVYGRANLPEGIGMTNNGSVNMLYNANDQRIYKSGGAFLDVSRIRLNVSEYYLIDAMGQTIGIFNFNLNEMNWYVYGNERVARLRHPVDLRFDLSAPDPVCPYGDPEHYIRCSTYFELNFVSPELWGWDGYWNFTQNEKADQVKEAAERLIPQGATASMSSLNLPNTLHEIMLPDSSRQMILSDEISSYPGAVILDTMELRSPFEQIALLNDSGEYTIYSLYRLSGVDPSLPPTMPSGDPFLIPMDKAEDPPYPDLVYYIHDHLGNARVLYHVTLACGEGPDPLDYYADHLVDYRPFGSILREYLPEVVPEKFLTTHHERDVQTGLDYRGARFYDSDLGRFLSVDPLAANFPRWSSYAYVYNSPIGLLDPTGMSPEDFFSGLSAEFGDYKEKEVEARQNNFDGENSITAYLVNQIGVKNIPEIINEVDRIFRRNNILGTIHYKVIAEMDGFDLPSFLSYEDNSLFLALTNSAFGNLGVSDINLYTGRLAVWVHHKDGYCGFKSCVDVPLVKQYFPGNWKYNLGLIIAHEYSHQLDAFSRMFLFNDLEGLPYEGHYNFDTDNLLMGGQRFSGLKKGGDHELLLPIIREQILKYIDR